MNKDFEYWKSRVEQYGDKSVMDLTHEKGLYDNELRKTAFSKGIKLKKDMKILDVGCGTGDWCIDYARAGCDVTGIDFVDNLINISRENAKKANLNIEFENQSLETYTKNNGYYDLVTSVTVLQHITDDASFKKSISNIFNLLRAGGTAAIIEYMPDKLKNSRKGNSYMKYRTKAEWVSYFERSGFKLIKEKSVRIVGFKLYNLFKHDLILRLSLSIDKILVYCDPLFRKYSDTRLLVFKKS